MSDGTTTWTNTYGADGLRTKRTDGTTTYRYRYTDGLLATMNIDDDVEMWFMYDDNGPLVIKYGNAESHKVYHYELNLQGDVIAIISTSGERVVEYTYDAWGNVLRITGSAAKTIGVHNPLRYRGYVYDHETLLYYCQSRYYNPETGRFLNADVFASTGQGLLGNNMFAYCGNNPVSRSDAEGTFWLALLVAAAVAGTVYDLSQLMVKDDGAVSASYTDNNESVQIANSKKIVTPWVQYGYSFYLNHFSEYKDYLAGSTMEITYEWGIHNIGYQVFEFCGLICDATGTDASGIDRYKNSCSDVDLGPTIYHDSGTGARGVMSTAMKIGYCITSPIMALSDAISYLVY